MSNFFVASLMTSKSVSHCQIESNQMFTPKIRLKIPINETNNTFFLVNRINRFFFFSKKVTLDPFFSHSVDCIIVQSIGGKKRHKRKLLIFTPLPRWETYIFFIVIHRCRLRFPFCVRIVLSVLLLKTANTHTQCEWMSGDDQKRKRKLCQTK